LANGVVSTANVAIAIGDVSGDAEFFGPVKPFDPKYEYFAEKGEAIGNGYMAIIGPKGVADEMSDLAAMRLANAPKSRSQKLTSIGEVLTKEERDLMKKVFKGEKDLEILPKSVRENAANVFEQTANIPGQHEAGIAFNRARAEFMRGQGPNPGASAPAFAKEHGVPLPGRGGK